MPQLKETQKDDLILITALLLFLILSGGIAFWSSQSSQPKIIGSASLIIDFGNGKKRAFEGEIIEGEKFVDALVQSSKTGNFSYQLDEKNNLAAIDNFSVGKNQSWYWYLNDKKISEPINEIHLEPGDKIVIKYE